MANGIKVGDVVQLKSGSPKMTVENIDKERALCSWFDAKGNPKEGWYSLAALVISKGSDFGGFPGR